MHTFVHIICAAALVLLVAGFAVFCNRLIQNRFFRTGTLKEMGSALCPAGALVGLMGLAMGYTYDSSVLNGLLGGLIGSLAPSGMVLGVFLLAVLVKLLARLGKFVVAVADRLTGTN